MGLFACSAPNKNKLYLLYSIKTMQNYTRKIDREYQKMLMKGAKTTTWKDGKPSIEIDPNNIQDANDHLVMSLFLLTQSEVDDMTLEDYNNKLEEVNKMRDFQSQKISSDNSKVVSDDEVK